MYIGILYYVQHYLWMSNDAVAGSAPEQQLEQLECA